MECAAWFGGLDVWHEIEIETWYQLLDEGGGWGLFSVLRMLPRPISSGRVGGFLVQY